MEFKYLISLVPFVMFIYYLKKWRRIDKETDKMVYGDNKHERKRYDDNATTYDLLTSRWKEKMITWLVISIIVLLLVLFL